MNESLTKILDSEDGEWYGDWQTDDGFKLLKIDGGRYLISPPQGFVDDLGSKIHRTYNIKGKNNALAFIAKIRTWQKGTS